MKFAEKPPEHLQLATAAFQRELNAVKKSLSPRTFPWYPYDTFGSTRPLDALLAPNSLEALRKLAGDQPLLDVGCGDGDLSFFLESFLGLPVDAVDYPPTNHNGMQAIRCLQRALGAKVDIHAMDVDTGVNLPRPLYGLTLFLGILYHLKNPFCVLETLAGHSQFCLLSTRVARTTPLGSRMDSEALAYLVAETELNADESNYWIFSEAGLRRILERSGWQVRGLITTGNITNSEPVRLDRDERAICVLESLRAPRRDAAQLLSGWYEGENGWRWTAREFAVELAPHPFESWGERKRLEFQFIVNENVANALGGITLQARIGGRDLGAQTFAGAGQHTYEASLPIFSNAEADATAEIVPAGQPDPRRANQKIRIDFALDRAYRPPSDGRELGLQVVFEKTGSAPPRHFVYPIRLI